MSSAGSGPRRGAGKYIRSLPDPAAPDAAAVAEAAEVRAAVGHRAPAEIDVGVRAGRGGNAEAEGELRISAARRLGGRGGRAARTYASRDHGTKLLGERAAVVLTQATAALAGRAHALRLEGSKEPALVITHRPGGRGTSGAGRPVGRQPSYVGIIVPRNSRIESSTVAAMRDTF